MVYMLLFGWDGVMLLVFDAVLLTDVACVNGDRVS